jgi:hypothetical protein
MISCLLCLAGPTTDRRLPSFLPTFLPLHHQIKLTKHHVLSSFLHSFTQPSFSTFIPPSFSTFTPPHTHTHTLSLSLFFSLSLHSLTRDNLLLYPNPNSKQHPHSLAPSRYSRDTPSLDDCYVFLNKLCTRSPQRRCLFS